MKYFLAASLVCALVGCASPTQNLDLNASVKQYHSQLQAQDFDDAAEFLPENEQESFVESYEKSASNLSIASFSVDNIRLFKEDGKDAADVIVSANAQLKKDDKLKKRTMLQHWVKDSDGQWKLVGTHKDFVIDDH